LEVYGLLAAESRQWRLYSTLYSQQAYLCLIVGICPLLEYRMDFKQADFIITHF